MQLELGTKSGRNYPSPSPSPSISCPTSPPRVVKCESSFYGNVGMTPEMFAATQIASFRTCATCMSGSVSSSPQQKFLQPNRKRKQSKPVKSVSIIDRSSFRIVKLDVFSMYRTNPSTLLYTFRKRDEEEILLKPKRKGIVKVDKNNYRGVYVDITHHGVAHRCSPTFRIRNADYQNTRNAPLPTWKGSGTRLDIPPSAPGYDELTTEELQACRILRIYPEQYLHMKMTLVSAVIVRGPYKKRDAQGWFKIDVNKTNKLYDWFKSLGWIPSEDWDKCAEKMIDHHYNRM